MSVFSLEGQVLKLDSAQDVQVHIQTMDALVDLEEIRLSGNTFGVEAGKAVASALKKHSGLKKAVLSDMFTGRLKTEIPQILEAIVEALEDKLKLEELDLSDNAFGPAGALPLQRLIINNRNIRRLYLNNNGLGIGGGKLISEALIESASKSKEVDGCEPVLELIVCGRNRLESEGSGYLATAFEYLSNLSCLKMPQNSIRPEGISKLVASLSKCPKLSTLDLQDNTFTMPGCQGLVRALDSWPLIEDLNVGECLLGAAGSKLVIERLKSIETLQKLHLSYNEIDEKAAALIPDMLMNKKKLILLELNGNAFEAESAVVDEIKSILRMHGNVDALDELDDMEILSEEEEEEEIAGESEDEDQVDGLSSAFEKTKLTA